MYPAAGGSGQLITTFVTFLLMLIPFIIFNGITAQRKGKSATAYTLLSFIPIVNFMLTLNLISLTDIDLKTKIEEIHNHLFSKQE